MEPTKLILRPFQQEALRAIARGVRHLAVSSPTGSGKSLIYETAARLHARKSILVTPLQALGIQQSQRLNRPGGAGEKPLRVGLGLAVHQRAHRGPPTVGKNESGIWIVSPEMLQTSSWWAQLRQYAPDLWIIDEAHCVWEWGAHFRPAYAALLQGSGLHQLLASRTLWLSATFPPQGLEELHAKLGPELEVQGEFQLPDHLRLLWENVSDPDRIERLLHWLKILGDQPGVIFVSSRTAAVRVGRLLDAAGLSNAVYHAGLSPEIRRALEAQLQDARAHVLVATSAFGLGMDFAHLRWGIFWELPYGVLDLAQRIGRVGRGAAARLTPATVVVLWHASQLKDRSDPLLKQVLETTQCRRQSFAQAFAAPHSREASERARRLGCCDYCLRIF